jgi:hypothetical protein
VTKWGLLRHYWVMSTLGITLVATAVLVTYTGTLDQLASIATEDPFTGRHPGALHSPSVIATPSGRFSCCSPPPCSRSTSRPG